METNKCFCKGVRICKICSEYKSNIIENKKKSDEKILLDKFISMTSMTNDPCKYHFPTELKIGLNFNSKEKLDIINYNIEISTIDFQSANNLNFNLEEYDGKSINIEDSFENKLRLLYNEIKFEINEESKNYNYYKNLINFIDETKSNFDKKSIFNGFYVIKHLFSEEEQNYLFQEISKNPWSESQSGRIKQDYGPKINYKKKKFKIEEINLEININKNVKSINDLFISEKLKDQMLKYMKYNFPYLSEERCCFYGMIEEKLKQIKLLNDFKIAEIGNLFYDYSKGAHIEPHIDDCWIWGKRIVGINLLSDTKLTFSKAIEFIDQNNKKKEILFEIDIPIKKGDLYIMDDFSRYIWKHSVKQENINSNRLVITLREFEETFLNIHFLENI